MAVVMRRRFREPGRLLAIVAGHARIAPKKSGAQDDGIIEICNAADARFAALGSVR
jgi:hypothetical protein